MEEEQNTTPGVANGGGGGDQARLLAAEGGHREVKSTETGACGFSGERGGLGSAVPDLGCWPGQ